MYVSKTKSEMKIKVKITELERTVEFLCSSDVVGGKKGSDVQVGMLVGVKQQKSSLLGSLTAEAFT